MLAILAIMPKSDQHDGKFSRKDLSFLDTDDTTDDNMTTTTALS